MKKIYLVLFFVSLCVTESFSQCATPATVPYNESFYSVTSTNQLPPCMTISDPTTCLTYTYSGRTGQSCAVFTYNPAQTSYFYSEAIQLSAGITYSSSAWYKTSFNNSNNNLITWTDFSILMGTGQNTTGLVQISSTNGSAENIIYTPVGGTFTVASGGVYYFAISATSNGSSGTSRLFWDDLDVQVACNVPPNMPTITVVTNPSVICQGQTNFSATASGADSYVWFDGTIGPTFTDTNSTISMNTSISVVGTNSLTTCTSTAYGYIAVLPTPAVIITGSTPTICAGESVKLSATGALFNSWNTGATSSSISVTPASSTNYTVVGTNAAGCSMSAQYLVTVDKCTGIKTNLLPGFKIFPNPGNGVYILESGNAELKFITLTDFTGKAIFSDQTNNESTPLNIEKFSNGIYFATVSCSGNTFTYKLIKH